MDNQFIKSTLRIAVPIMFQQVLNTITNLVDTFMIGKLGEASIAGVGLASKVFFVLVLIVFGTASGLGVLASQYWGNKDMKRIHEVTGIALSITVTVSVLVMIACLITPVGVMGIFTNSADVAAEGAKYLRIVCISYPLIAISNTVCSSLRSIGKVNAPLFCSSVAIVVNIFFNYCLIFGNFGFPAMGVAGAACATLIARASELVILIIYLKKNRLLPKGVFREMFDWEPQVIKQYVAKSLPVTANETLWGLGITMYALCYGRISAGAAASMTIVETFTDIELVGVMGLSHATAIILGNELGEGKLEEAKKHADWDMILAIIAGVIMAIFTFFVKDAYISIYDVSAESAQSIRQCLNVYCIALIFRCFNTVTVVGILRSGGDTIVCALIDILPIWLCTVPLVFLSGLVWKLPLYMVFFMANVDEIIKLFVSFARVKQYKWLKNLNTELSQIE